MIDLPNVVAGGKVVTEFYTIVWDVNLAELGQLGALVGALLQALFDALPQAPLHHVVGGFEAHLAAKDCGIFASQAPHVADRAIHTVFHVAADAEAHGGGRVHFAHHFAVCELDYDCMVDWPGIFEKGRLWHVQAVLLY